uniref:Gustatory receptor n=1 Tax=Anopheles coluzzii TaxID=1518534 RepID=A0A6E8VMB3_ANOCL
MNTDNIKPTDSSFCRIMKPIYLVSKMAGLWPQSFLRASPGVTVLDIGYLIVLYAMYFFFILVNTNAKLWDYYMKPFESDILRYGLQTHLVNGLFLGVVIVTINVVQYQKKWDYMELLDNVTKVVEQEFHVRYPIRVVQTFIVIVISSELIYLVVILAGYYYLIDQTLNITTKYLYASYYMMNISLLALINEYIYFTVHIRRLFMIVNRLLKQLLLGDTNESNETVLLDQNRKSKTPTIAYDEIFTVYGRAGGRKIGDANAGGMVKSKGPPKVTMVAPASAGFNKLSATTVYTTYITQLKIDNQSSMETILKTVNRLSVLHYHLCDAIRLVNRISSLSLMFHFGAMFVFLVFGLFTIYKAFNSGTWAFRIMAIANGAWIAFYLVGILSVITATTAAQTSGRMTGDIVHQIIRKHQNHFSVEVIEKLSTLSLQVTMRDMSFSCGLFNFDWSLFGSILSALAMYLVFLIQFDVAPPVGLNSPNLTIPSIELIDFEV